MKNQSTTSDVSIAEAKKKPAPESTSSFEQNETMYQWIGLSVLFLMFGGFITWAALFELDQAVVAPGRVIVSDKNKQVQHFDGGIIKKILVQDGDIVKKDDLLFVFDDTQLTAQLESVNGQLWEAAASFSRLKAERDGEEITWSDSGINEDDVPHEVKKTHNALFQARKKSFSAQESMLKQNKIQSQKQILALEQQIQGQHERTQGVLQQIEGQKQRIESQSERIKAELERIKGQSQRILGQDQQVEGYNEQIKGQDQKATGIRQHIIGLKKRIQSIEEQIRSNYRQRMILDNDIARLEKLFQKEFIGDQELIEQQLEREQIIAVIASLRAEISNMESQISQSHSEIAGTVIESARIKTEISRTNSQTANIRNETAGMRAEVAAQRAEKEEMKIEIRRLHSNIAEIKTEIGRMGNEVSRIKENIVEVDHQIVFQKEQYFSEVGDRMSQLLQQLPQLIGQKKSLLDKLSRISVTAPVSGKIKGLEITTLGAVVQSGQMIMDLVPITQDFSITAEISPIDIDAIDSDINVNSSQKVEIRLSVFDEARLFPVLFAKLTNVSTDTLMNEQSGELYYKAYLTLDNESLALLNEKNLHLISGMPVEILIVTGKRSMLDYLLKPFEDIAAHAFNEH